MKIARIFALIFAIIINTSHADPTVSLYYSLPSEYVLGQSSPTISEYNISYTDLEMIQQLKFSVSASGLGTVSNVSITTGGQTFSAPVVGNVADIQGLNIPVPAGPGGINIFVTPSYAAVGGPNGLSSNTKSTLALSYVKSTNPTTQYVSTSATSVASSTMTLVSTKPMVYLASGDNTSLVNGQFKLADITVAADQAGNLSLAQIPLSIKTFGNVNIPSQTLVIKDANNNIVTNASASLSAVGINSTGLVNISFSSGYMLGAGTAQTFKVYADVQGVTGNAGTNSITSLLGAPSSFQWNDINGNVTGLTGDLLPGASYSPTTGNVPEPTTAALLTTGVILSLTNARKRRS